MQVLAAYKGVDGVDDKHCGGSALAFRELPPGRQRVMTRVGPSVGHGAHHGRDGGRGGFGSALAAKRAPE
eukprot:11215651-Lingulodinium_polyedra.AAC.1